MTIISEQTANSPVLSDERTQKNAQNFGKFVETVKGGKRRGRPRRHREERIGPDDTSRRSRTLDEACHNPSLPAALPSGVAFEEAVEVALRRAQYVHGMSENDRSLAEIIVDMAIDGRIVRMPRLDLLQALHDAMSMKGRRCPIGSINGLRMLEQRLADYGLIWHADTLDVTARGTVGPADGGRRGRASCTGLDIAPIILGYHDNVAMIESRKAELRQQEIDQDRCEYLRPAVLNAIRTLYGVAGALPDRSAGQALRDRAAAFSERRSALWKSGSPADLEALLKEVQAAVPRVAKAGKIGNFNNEHTAHRNVPNSTSKFIRTPLLQNLQGGAEPPATASDPVVDRTDKEAIQHQEIAYSEDRSRFGLSNERSMGLGVSEVPPAAHNLELGIYADDHIPDVDGLGDQDNGVSGGSPARREWRPDGIPAAIMTGAGCRALLAVVPALRAAAEGMTVTGPVDLVAAVERVIMGWTNPTEIRGKAVNPKAVATARARLIAERGETVEDVAAWVLSVATAANAARVSTLRESLARSILGSIKRGYFDNARFPTRSFWAAFAAEGGAVDEPAVAENVVPFPASRSVEDVVEVVEAAVDPIMEMVTAPVPAPAPASKPVQVTDPALAAAFGRVKETAEMPLEKGPTGIVMPSPRPTPAPTAAPAPKPNPIADLVARDPEVAARLAALKKSIGITTAPTPKIPVGRPMTPEEDLAFVKAAVSATPTRCGEDLYPCSVPLRAVGVRPPPPLPVQREQYCPEDLPDEGERDMPEEEYDPYDIDPHEHAARIRNGVEWPF